MLEAPIKGRRSGKGTSPVTQDLELLKATVLLPEADEEYSVQAGK